MLLLMGVQQCLTLRALEGNPEYNRRIREMGASVPNRIGSWIGEDAKIPFQAMGVLKPNLMVCRHYTNIESGVVAGVLLDHCSDAHRMVGHYPPRCFPADGWTTISAQPCELVVDGRRIRGMEYCFTRASPGTHKEETISVFNFLMRPNGKILQDMEELSQSIRGAAGPSFGAGQVQVYFSMSVPEASRIVAAEQLLAGCKPVLDAILANVAGAP